MNQIATELVNNEVDVIIPHSKVMNVYENDYLLYLASLIRYKEYYITELDELELPC